MVRNYTSISDLQLHTLSSPPFLHESSHIWKERWRGAHFQYLPPLIKSHKIVLHFEIVVFMGIPHGGQTLTIRNEAIALFVPHYSVLAKETPPKAILHSEFPHINLALRVPSTFASRLDSKICHRYRGTKNSRDKERDGRLMDIFAQQHHKHEYGKSFNIGHGLFIKSVI